MRGLTPPRTLTGPALAVRLQSWLVMVAMLCLLPSGSARSEAIAADAPEAAAPQAQTAGVKQQRPASVILLVYEELPLNSLLDETGEIDAARFPAFAALASESTWVVGASSVGKRTLDAVPSILTGKYPRLNRDFPIHAAHPNNLFQLLAQTHELSVYETETLLMPSGGFDRQGNAMPTSVDLQIEKIKRMRRDMQRGYNEPGVIRSFTNHLKIVHDRAPPDRGTLHFAHVLFPERPWRFTRTGQYYAPNNSFGNFGEMWSEEPWWAEEAQRRHIMQVQYSDLLVGRLMAELRRVDLYDRSLVIVTSAFGAGFWPGESRLSPIRTEHPEDVLNVPLLIKLPGQKTAKRHEGTVEIIDILPTIADVLEIAVPWEIDGCSIFDAACPERTARKALVAGDGEGRRYRTWPPDVVKGRAGLERRIELMGTGGTPEKMYRFGPYASLVGREVAPLVQGDEAAGRVGRRKQSQMGAVRGPKVRFQGQLRLAAEVEATPHVAVALNGRIETVVPVPFDRRQRRMVLALLPEEKFQGEGDTVTAHLVVGTPEAPSLRPLEVD